MRIELTIEVLQTSALPLGYRASHFMKTTAKTKSPRRGRASRLERETGFEPATSTLARSHSTTELLPLGSIDYKQAVTSRQRRPHSDKAMLNFDTERPRHKKRGTPQPRGCRSIYGPGHPVHNKL